MKLTRNSDGIWTTKASSIHGDSIYRESLTNYLNRLDELFSRAKTACEFEFILTLLRVKGMADPGWDVYENTQSVFRCISQSTRRIKDFEAKRHIYLWLYGHIIEASEPYEILANLINVASGGRYGFSNFPDKIIGKKRRSIPQSPSEKIDTLNEMVQGANLIDFSLPINDFYDKDLRNAVFHADYSLFDGELRIQKPLKSYSNEETQAIINKALAYHEGLQTVLTCYTQMYDSPKLVPVHPEFARSPNEKAITIVRKGYGLVGIKDSWTKDEIRAGRIPWSIARLHVYENRMLDEDPLNPILPKDKIARSNRFLLFVPRPLKKHVLASIKKKLC